MNEWAWGSGGMVTTDEYRSSPRKICPSVTSSTTNPTWTALGSHLRIPAHNLIVENHSDYWDVRYQILPVPVAARSKALGCDRSLGGITGFESRRDRCLCLWVLCIVRWRSLRWAVRSSRGVLPSWVCLSVIVKPRQWGGRGQLGAVVP